VDLIGQHAVRPRRASGSAPLSEEGSVMDLERLVARLDLDATQFRAELDRVERELRRVDQTGRQASDA
jgi:hypothetical protein